MPVIKCQNCGGITNSAVSDYWDEATGWKKASECYARWIPPRECWVPGCAFATASPDKIRFARSILRIRQTRDGRFEHY